MKGQIIKIIAGFYDVICRKKIYRVKAAGKLKNLNIKPLVGDYVEFQPQQFITQIFSRKNYLERPKVANIDQIVIIQSLSQPNFASLFVNKLLSNYEFNNIKVILVFTKSDLGLDKENKTIFKQYLNDNYEVFLTNKSSKKSFALLKKKLENKLSVLVGQSGVGKTTLINILLNKNLETKAISESSKRGKHTTRVVEIIFSDDKKIRIIDTPGFLSFNNVLSKQQLAKSFKDFKRLSKDCAFFKNCLHFHEKECAVKNAVKNGKISKQRYNDYLILLREVE